MIMQHQVKKWTDKKKQICSLCFVNKFKFQQVQDRSKKMLGKKNIKKRSGKATGHNDHYMINMGGQRQKIGGNWRLTSPYLQGWGGIFFS